MCRVKSYIPAYFVFSPRHGQLSIYSKTSVVARVMTVLAIVVLGLVCASSPRFDAEAMEVVGDNVQRLADRVFEFSEDIVVQGNATLLIENATVRFVQTAPYKYGIRLEKPANGNPRLIVRNATLESTRAFKVTLAGESFAELSGLQFRHYLELYNSSKANILDRSSVYYLRAYDSSHLTALGSDVYYIYGYNSSQVDISTCIVNRIETYDESSVNVSISTVKNSVDAYDSSSVSVQYSSLFGSVSSREASSVFLGHDGLSGVEVEATGNSEMSLVDSKILASRTASEFLAEEFSTFYVCNSSFANCRFLGADNSTLEIERSDLTFAYVYCVGNASFQVQESSLDWLVECQGESRISAVNSSFVIASGRDSSSLVFNSCNISVLRGFEDSEILVSNSIIEKGMLELDSANVTFAGFGADFFHEFKFSASGPNFTLSETKITDGWSLRLTGSSDVTLKDSSLLSLVAYDSAKVRSWNSTLLGINLKGDSEVRVWSYLTVRVIDSFGSPVKGASVTVTDAGITIESHLTQGDGTAVFELFEKSINASGVRLKSDYAVDVAFGGDSLTSSIDLNGSQTLTLTIQSAWYWYVILAAVVIIVLVVGFAAFFMVRRKRKSER